MLGMLLAGWALAALGCELILRRFDHVTLPLRLAVALGPIGLVVVWLSRSRLHPRPSPGLSIAERERKEQAWREWHGP